MNTLKPLLIVAVLAGIGYGVYVRINSGHDAPPPGVAEGWDTVPKVQLPEGDAPAGAPAWGPGGGPASSGIAPAFGGSRAMPPSGAPQRGSEGQPPANPFQGPAAPQYVSPGGSAPAYGDTASQVPNGPEQTMPDQAPPQANPYEHLPPHNGAAQAPPPVDYGTAEADRYRNQGPAGAPPMDAGAVAGFAAVVESARRELEAGQMATALRQLSSLYDDPRLSPQEQQELTQLLDQVAGTVVYSTQHLLAAPYEVQPGERLEDIAQRCNVPWQLLAKINGIDDPQSLRPGERLKVVQGPFNAVISLEKRQMTLLLGDGSYAGRFHIGIGREHPPQEGTFAVADKVVNPVYHGRDRTISAEDQSNPLGERWIGLGRELGMGIHGTNHPESIDRPDLPGSINLAPRDVEDVFDILSLGSKVTIRR